MVIYFTGTGNSRYAAETIAIHTDYALVSANKYIKDGKSAELSSPTPFVFVCPTYAWKIPRIFEEFIENASFAGNDSAYFVMTCGDDIGNAEHYLKKLCKKCKLQYMGTARLVMPENYVALYDVPNTTECEAIIAEADKALERISELIKNVATLPRESAGLLAAAKSKLINPIFYSVYVNAKGFHVTDKCIGCGKCEQLCPLNNIKLTAARPVYGDCCTHCMACICACPTEAIEYKQRTVGKDRYYNNSHPKAEE